jgi:hypothetical protein
LRINIWGGANRIPRIPRKGLGVRREFSWKEVGDKKKLIGNTTFGEGAGVRHIRKKKRGKGILPLFLVERSSHLNIWF